MIFEWDENKNIANIKKHGIGFAEACSAFYDDKAILFDDPDHSKDEERFLLIGMSISARVMIVSHCYRSKGEKIRIISARKATKSEVNYYIQGGG